MGMNPGKRRSIPFAAPTLGEEEAQAAREAILSGWVTQGPRVREFERAFASYTGAAHACAVANCTTALHLALKVAGVQPGDVVLTVSHSFIASANVVRYCQAEPVFVDIDPATINVDPEKLAWTLENVFEERGGDLWYKAVDALAVGQSPLDGRKAPMGRLAAILAVHQLGMPADLKSILPIAERRGLPVVEDAACAIGSEISMGGGANWERIGRPHADIACFSFHPRKVVTTGDGGMLTTDKPEYDRIFRLLRHHGMSATDMDRHKADDVFFEDYVETGFNYRMTDIQAAIGIEQLRRLPDLVQRRRELARLYREGLADIPGLETQAEPPYAKSNWQSFLVRLSRPDLQRPVMRCLQGKGVSSRRGVMCAHLEPIYADAWPVGSFPKSERARDYNILLPFYTRMDVADVEYVVNALQESLKEAE